MRDKIIKLLNKVNREGIKELINWLEQIDYFTAPSSQSYHCNYEGGLAEHSYNVYTLLKEKNERFNLGLSEDNVIISALLHDICKVKFYKKDTKWRKDSNNKWESYEAYVIEDTLPLGHGEKSVILAQAFIKLKKEEIFLIRYHMGGFLNDTEKKSLHKAVELIPAIVAIHTADYEASTYLEKKVEY